MKALIKRNKWLLLAMIVLAGLSMMLVDTMKPSVLSEQTFKSFSDMALIGAGLRAVIITLGVLFLEFVPFARKLQERGTVVGDVVRSRWRFYMWYLIYETLISVLFFL